MRPRYVALGAGVAVAGGLVWALGPGAPHLVSWLANGANAWRLGELRLEGVTGPHIGALRAERFTLRDEHGVWAEARDIELDWSPQALLFGDIEIAQISAAELDILRRPALSAPKPAGWFQPGVNIVDMHVDRIDLAEPVAGRAALLRFTGAFEMEGRDFYALALDIVRLDAETDRLALRINQREGELLAVALEGAPDGVIASALGVAGSPVRLDAQVQGDNDAGAGTLRGTIGTDRLADAALQWDDAAWRLNATLNPGRAPIFEEIVARVGPVLAIETGGARDDNAARPFTLALRADNLTLDASGELDAKWRIDGEVQVAAETPSINRMLPELTLNGREASLEGELTLASGRTLLRGDIQLGALGAGDVRAEAGGRFTFTWTDRAADIHADLALTPRGSRETQRLLANATLSGRVRYDRQTRRTEIQRIVLTGDAVRGTASGAIARGAGLIEGEWRVLSLAAASPAISGGASGTWQVERVGEAPWRLTARGAAQNFAARNGAIAQLLGRAPALDLDGDIADGGLRVRSARVQSPRLRAGARGLLAGRLNLQVEATARGPILLGRAEISGAADAAGRITGPLGRPRIEMDARMDRFDLAGAAIEQPHLQFTYDSATGAGEARVEGMVAGAPATAQALVRTEDAALVFTDLDVHAIGLDATGAAALGPDGPSLDLDFSGALAGLDIGAAGALQGRVTLASERGAPPVLDLAADLRNASFGDLRLSQANLSVRGPIDLLAARARIRGLAGETPITMDIAAQIATANGRTLTTLEARGDLGGETLATREPAMIELADGRIDARASVTAGSGSAELTWRTDGGRFAATAQFDGAELAPFAALAGSRAEGAISGQARIASEGGGLTGAADLEIAGARLPARMRSPLDMRIDVELSPNRITGEMQARSGDGLDAAIEGSAPVTTAASPLRIALADSGEGSARWRVRGPADSLWSLVGGLDQSLGGRVDGEGEIRFTSTALTGAGELSLTDGRFEDKRAGLLFVDVDARLEFARDGASRFTISARDEDGGRLTGSGAAQRIREGRIDLDMQRLRFVDREDMRATATGDIALVWNREGATLAGDLALDTAEVTLSTRSDAVVPEIDVIEINRPGGDLPPERPRAAAAAAANLDLRLTAPGRLYTRGRGLNAEWSLDARLTGTSIAPRIEGEARLVRGDFDLAGRPFELERGRIMLTGALEDTTVDLLAERSEPDLTARIAITGLLFDPTITLSSDPALPEDEILPNILFGRSSEDLSPLEGAQLAASLAALAGGAAFDIAGMARAAVGLDRFDVREDEAGVLISGGRYLTRDVYFEIQRTGLGEPGARVEWRARPQLSLVTSFLANGDQRVSVRWRRDY